MKIPRFQYDSTSQVEFRDELVELTPKNIRIRKVILDAVEERRKKIVERRLSSSYWLAVYRKCRTSFD